MMLRSLAVFSVLLACAMAVSACAQVDRSLFVETPFGWRHKDCIMEASHVQRVRHGVLRINRELEVSVPAICRDEKSWIRTRPRSQRRPTDSTWGPNNYTCDSLPCCDWMDNAGYELPAGDTNYFRAFSGVYHAPLLPVAGMVDQTLFYFLGLENTDGLGRHGPNRVILQPVLTLGNGFPENMWHIRSWACCPEGMTTFSPAIRNVNPGATVDTFVNKTSDTEGLVVASFSPSGMENSSLTTTLHIDLNGPPDYRNRYFNWADVTMEIYNVFNCSMLARGPMRFSNLTLYDKSYNAVPFPKTWAQTGARPCQGSVTVSDGTVVITHNPM